MSVSHTGPWVLGLRLPGTEHLLNKYLKIIYVIVCLVSFSNLLSVSHLMCLVYFWSKINPSHSTLYIHQTTSWIRTPSRTFFSDINTKNNCASPKQLVCECTIICSTVNLETDCISLFALVLKEIQSRMGGSPLKEVWKLKKKKGGVCILIFALFFFFFHFLP